MLDCFRNILAIAIVAGVICFASIAVPDKVDAPASKNDSISLDSIPAVKAVKLDSLKARPMRHAAEKVVEYTYDERIDEYKNVDGSPMWLSEADIRLFASETGLEVAAVKAVIDIETGRSHKAFWAVGKPIINFDRFVFKQMADKNKINLEPYQESHALVFNKAVYSDYSQQQRVEQERLDCAMTIDTVTAIEGTFWGMFQIGGFNWKRCKTASPQQFVELMSRSALDQLELFGALLENSSMMRYLKNLDWEEFAFRYNGPGYKKHNYHGRLNAAYLRHKSQEANAAAKDTVSATTEK